MPPAARPQARTDGDRVVNGPRLRDIRGRHQYATPYTVPPLTHVSIDLAVDWQGPCAVHRDCYRFADVDLRHDTFPGSIGSALARAAAGETVREDFAAGELITLPTAARVKSVPLARADPRFGPRRPIEPGIGRFYPRQLLAGITDEPGDDHVPFRYLGMEQDCLKVDLNHPLGGYPLTVEARLVDRFCGVGDRHRASARDMFGVLADSGPGIQCAANGVGADRLIGNAFARDDEDDDSVFYRRPRFVDHLDAAAIAEVTAVYRRFLAPGMRVLDLMGSWHSHLPDGAEDMYVVGLGLNGDELTANPVLSDHVIHDLNRNPRLPFADDLFDVVVCTASIEYLVHPLDVCREVARVLKRGAPFVITFSDRWFPPKVTRLWTVLHPFERMGLVIEHLRRTGRFEQLQSESKRGLNRPTDDKYIGITPFSDPLYVVSGRSLV